MTEAFRGFPKGGAAFFAQLAKKQDRDWFKANKERYETLWQQPMEALLATVAPKLARTFPDVADAKPKVMRIYRDTRFSKDKSPFKTNIGATLPFSSAPAAPALYVHGSAEKQFAGFGVWHMEPDVLARFREAVADAGGAALAKELAKLHAKGFELLEHEPLKRVPAPYPADHPRGALLKLRGFGLSYPKVPAGLTATPKYADWIVAQSKAASKVIDWLETALA